MKIKYKIIWIDDRFEEEESPFTDIRDNLIKYLYEEHFFEVEINSFENVDNFKTAVLEDEYDLILTDFHLNDGKTGAEVIDFVRREKNIFTEIFFYSAKPDLETDQRLINNNRVTYYTLSGNNYRELQSQIKSLIDLTLQKFNHIVAMRGMIMHETSNLDHQSLNIIEHYFDKYERDETIIDNVFDEIIYFHKEKLKKAEKFKKNARLDKIIKDPVVFSSHQRANTLSKIIDKEELQNFISDYKKEIILVRNQFAHAILDDTAKIFKTKGGEEFNEELCKKIRRDINKHVQNLQELEKLIGESI